MADRYWVGGTATWDGTAGTKWATSSGGAGGASVPTSSDNVYFDGSSGSGTITTSGTTTDVCNNLDCTGFTGTIGGSGRLNIYGNLTLGSGMTLGSSVVFDMYGTGTGKTVTTASKTLRSILFLATGEWTLQDNMTLALGATIGGTFITNGNTLILNEGGIVLSSGGVFDISNSDVYLSRTTAGTLFTGSSGSIVTTGSEIIVNGSGSNARILDLFNRTFNKITIEADNIKLNYANTIATLAVNTAGMANGLILESGRTQTITTAFITNGSSGNLAKISSSTPGSAATLSKSSGTINVEYMSIKDSTATGGATWKAYNSTDVSGNTGWVFGYYGEASISGDSSVSSEAFVTYFAQALLTGDAQIIAEAVVQLATNTIDKKYILYKVYDSSDNFLGTWNDVVSDFTYPHEINQQGTIVDIELARSMDSLIIEFQSLITTSGDTLITQDSRGYAVETESRNPVGDSSNVDLNLKVKVYVFYGQTGTRVTEDDDIRITEGGDVLVADEGAPNGYLIFQGYISRFAPKFGNSDNTVVSVSSFGSQLDNYLIHNGSTLSVAYNSYDPSATLKAILDNFVVDGGDITYGSGTVQMTSTVTSYTFKTNTVLEGIKKCQEMAPSDWFWYLDMGANEIYFLPKPTAPDHTFIKGKHFTDLYVEKTQEGIVNDVLFTGAETAGTSLLMRKQDTDSQTSYGVKLKRLSDQRVSSQDSAQILAQGEIDRYKDPRYRVTVTISAEAYNIESIKLGHLITFRNNNNFVDNLELMVIRYDYTPYSKTLQLDTLLPSVSKRIEDIKRNLDLLESVNNPTTAV